MAELCSNARHYYVAGFEHRKDEDYQRLTFLEHKIRLMLNPNEEDHRKMDDAMGEMLNALDRGKDKEFIAAHREVMNLSCHVFKREWDRVKDRIALATS